MWRRVITQADDESSDDNEDDDGDDDDGFADEWDGVAVGFSRGFGADFLDDAYGFGEGEDEWEHQGAVLHYEAPAPAPAPSVASKRIPPQPVMFLLLQVIFCCCF